MKKIITALFLLFVFSFYAYAEGIATLKEIDKSKREMAKDLKTETENFNRLKKAAGGGAVNKGASKTEIIKKFGEPVVVIEDYDGFKGVEKWVYKPGESSFFKGEKIYLFFDGNGILNNIKLVE